MPANKKRAIGGGDGRKRKNKQRKEGAAQAETLKVNNCSHDKKGRQCCYSPPFLQRDRLMLIRYQRLQKSGTEQKETVTVRADTPLAESVPHSPAKKEAIAQGEVLQAPLVGIPSVRHAKRAQAREEDDYYLKRDCDKMVNDINQEYSTDLEQDESDPELTAEQNKRILEWQQSVDPGVAGAFVKKPLATPIAAKADAARKLHDRMLGTVTRLEENELVRQIQRKMRTIRSFRSRNGWTDRDDFKWFREEKAAEAESGEYAWESARIYWPGDKVTDDGGSELEGDGLFEREAIWG